MRKSPETIKALEKNPTNVIKNILLEKGVAIQNPELFHAHVIKVGEALPEEPLRATVDRYIYVFRPSGLFEFKIVPGTPDGDDSIMNGTQGACCCCNCCVLVVWLTLYLSERAGHWPSCEYQRTYNTLHLKSLRTIQLMISPLWWLWVTSTICGLLSLKGSDGKWRITKRIRYPARGQCWRGNPLPAPSRSPAWKSTHKAGRRGGVLTARAGCWGAAAPARQGAERQAKQSPLGEGASLTPF